MISKEDALERVWNCKESDLQRNVIIDASLDSVKQAMDIYARDVSIYFMEWVMLKHKSGNMDLIGKNSFEGFDLFDKEVLQKINKKENNTR